MKLYWKISVIVDWFYSLFRVVILKKCDRGMVQFMRSYYSKQSLVGAEIGVCQGYNARNMFRLLNIKKMYLIDPYCVYINEHGMMTNFDCFEKGAHRLLSHFKDKIIWIKDFSYNVSDLISDNSLDFVYIDGNHSKEGLTSDIMLYLPKVKVGGVLGGHDYNPCFPAVSDVVNGFVKRKGWKLYGGCGTELSSDWWVVKGEKRT